MENASKALIFAASILIAIMLMAFMMYVFRRMGVTAKDTEARMGQKEIDAFNSKFIDYATDGGDGITITHVKGNNGRTVDESKFIPFYGTGSVFSSSTSLMSNKPDYYKALIGVSQTLNKPMDVVTAIYDAIDVNYRNSNGYQYGYVELQNSVEIIIDLGNYRNEFKFSKIKDTSDHFRYLVIEPNSNIKAENKNIYGVKEGTTLQHTSDTYVTEQKLANTQNVIIENDSNSANYNKISVYNMLEELRDTNIIPYQDFPIQDPPRTYTAIMDEAGLDRQHTIFQYYFKGEVFFNKSTGLVESVRFTLVKDENFRNN